MQIEIGGPQDPGRRVELPAHFDSLDAAQKIEIAAQEISLESSRRKAKRRVKHQSDPWISWVRPVCYRFIDHCLENGLEDHLRSRIRRYGRSTSSDDIFSVSLLAIFADDPADFTEADRHKISRQLWYAYRHYVPWQFLNGFLSQLPKFESQKALSKIEPGFEDWIIMRRSVDYTTRTLRGRYPANIEAGALETSTAIARLFEGARKGR